MDKLEEKRQQEKEMVTLMIKLYCKKKHRSKTYQRGCKKSF